jgi:hypothetical protein
MLTSQAQPAANDIKTLGGMSYLLALGHCGGQPAVVEPVGAQNGHLRGISVESMQKLRIDMFHMVVLSDELIPNLRDPSLRQPARLRKGN